MAIKELFYDQRPVALLNPRASQRIDPRFKFTRNSTATYIDQDGLIKYSGNNEPRIPYDYGNSAELGLLLEPERTNGFLASQDFTNAYWNYNNEVTITLNAATAPDGSNTASLIVPTAVDAIHRIGRNSAGSSGTVRTYSLFAKAAGYNYMTLNTSNSGFFNAVFNLLNGSYIPPAAGNPYTAGIEKLANGWWRIWLTTVSGFVPVFTPYPTFEAIAANTIWTGNGTSGVYLWGAQWEDTYDHPTSYISTSGAAATRSADLLAVDSLTIPQTGSLYVDAQAARTEVNSTLLSLKNASNQKLNLAMEERSELYNSLALTYSIKGTVKPTLPYPVPTTNRELNIITWGTNNYQYNTDGARFAPSLSTTPGIPANLTQLSIGHDAVDPTKAFNGYINAVYLYNGEITPTVAEALVRGELDPVNADTYSPVGPTGSLALIINTQGASSTGDKVFALPAESALNDNDIVITWGDGTESGLDGAAAELGAAGLSHTYPSAGIYPIWVEGKLENLQFNNSASAPDLVKIEKWSTTANGNDVFLSPSTMNSAFYGCSKLTSMPTSGLPDTSAVTDWLRAFSGCSSLTGTFPSFSFSAATTFQETFQKCSSLTSFTAAGDQTQNVTNFVSAWRECSGLTSFPLINTSSGTDFSVAWFGCSSLTSFPLLNTSSGTRFNNTWEGCSSLTSFPLINTSSGTQFQSAWAYCSSLTSFPLLNTSSGANFRSAWAHCTSLTSLPLLNTSSATDLAYAWYNCSALASFPLLDTSSNLDLYASFYNCVSLTSLPLINTSACTVFTASWSFCASLASFPLINTSSGTSFYEAWRGCTALTSFPALDFSSAIGLSSDASNITTGFVRAWLGCTSLTDFPANRFNTTTCTRYLDAWTGCALTAQSIENILVSINAAGTSNGNLGIGGGTNAAKTTWSSAANTAYDALVARGWTITFNA